MTDDEKKKTHAGPDNAKAVKSPSVNRQPLSELGGPKGPEPTRYGDWEIGGKCVDF